MVFLLRCETLTLERPGLLQLQQEPKNHGKTVKKRHENLTGWTPRPSVLARTVRRMPAANAPQQPRRNRPTNNLFILEMANPPQGGDAKPWAPVPPHPG